jgi:hypothetical protein
VSLPTARAHAVERAALSPPAVTIVQLVTMSRRRKIGGRRRSGPRPGRAIKSNGRAAGYNRETLKSIREWAKQNGHNVSDRGRLPAEVLQAWQTAQGAMSRA